MSVQRAKEQLEELIETYQKLTEREKFSLGKVFHDATGGKLSPFNSPSPVAVGLVPVMGENGQIGFLGVRRAIAPCVGEVALAGGFISPNEEPVAGMVREVLEETGIEINPHNIVSAGVPRAAHNNNMLVFLRSTDVLDFDTFQTANEHLSTATDGEASELVFITPDTPLCFPLHQEAVNQQFEGLGLTPRVKPEKSFKP